MPHVVPVEGDPSTDRPRAEGSGTAHDAVRPRPATTATAERNTLLAGLPPAELVDLSPHLQLVVLRPKHLFLTAEAPLSHVYFPLAGLMALTVPGDDGATVQVAMVGREGMLGASVVLEASPASFEMVCLVAGEALRMPAADCARLAQQLPTFRRRLLRYSRALLHQAARTAACVGLHRVEQRLACWLLLACARLGTDTFPMTHDVLAQMLGVTRPFVTQTARALETAGLIQHKRGMVRVVDSAGLEALACEDYRAIQDAYTRRFE